MPTVRVALGATMNYGNFESGRFDFEITDEVRSGETIDQAFDRVERKVEDRLVKRMEEERHAKRDSTP
jgi:hypothetical protein